MATELAKSLHRMKMFAKKAERKESVLRHKPKQPTEQKEHTHERENARRFKRTT